MMLFLKQLCRSPVKLIAFLLLLVFAGTLGSVGLNVYNAASTHERNIEESYTTIAIPNYMPEAYTLEFNDLDVIDESNPEAGYTGIAGLLMAQEERLEQIEAAVDFAVTLEHVTDYEKREYLGGYCPGLTPVFNDNLYEFGAQTYPYDLAMFSITCLNTLEDTRMLFTVDEIIYESAAQQSARLEAGQDENTSAPTFDVIGIFDGDALRLDEMHEGDRLLVWGNFEPNKDGLFQTFWPGGATGFANKLKTKYPELPVCVRLPEGMSAAEYLESTGEFDPIIDMIEKTRQSIKVVTSENLRSIAAFATSETPIIYGRDFTAEECETGERVCVISASLAVQNGLDLGDSFDMTLYNCQMAAGINLGGIAFEPYFEGFCADAPSEEYEIVGIYSDSGFRSGMFDFTPNTVFIPAGAVKDEALITHVENEAFKTRTPMKMESIVLENGSIAAFEADMEEAGYGECFIYEDQGYSQIMQSTKAIGDNGRRLILFAAAVFIVAMALYAFLYGVNFKASMITLRLLGAPGRKAYCAAVLSALGFAAFAFVIGGFISFMIFSDVFKLLSESVKARFSPSVALLALGAQIIIAALPCMLLFKHCLRKNPLPNMKK